LPRAVSPISATSLARSLARFAETPVLEEELKEACHLRPYFLFECESNTSRLFKAYVTKYALANYINRVK